MDLVAENNGKIRWESAGLLVVERPFYGAEKVLMEQRDMARAELAHVKEVEFPRRAEKVAEGWRKKCEALQTENERMRDALTVARDTFALYAERHREKKTPDGDTKAALNADLALRMDSALTPNEQGDGRL